MQDESSVENSDSPRMRKLTVNSKPVARENEACEQKSVRRPVTAEEHRIEKEKLLK